LHWPTWPWPPWARWCSTEDIGRWLGLLALYDGVFVLLAVAVFDYLLED
jgi:hypothetical protein